MYFWQSFVYASFATITQYGNKVGGIVDLWFLNSDFIKQFLKAFVCLLYTSDAADDDGYV